MNNITPGHWIFAGIFAVAFIGYLVWAYTKDSPIYKQNYRRVWLILLVIVVSLFLIYVFKNQLK